MDSRVCKNYCADHERAGCRKCAVCRFMGEYQRTSRAEPERPELETAAISLCLSLDWPLLVFVDMPIVREDERGESER